MKHGKAFLLFIFLFQLFHACNTSIDSKKGIIDKFNANRKDFDLLLADLKASPVVDSPYASELVVGHKAGDFLKHISDRLFKLSISDVYLHYGNCRQKIFVFKTKWSSKVPVIADNNPCDSNRTVEGYFEKDKNSNEIYGLGNFWQVYKEVKVIE